MSDGAIDTQREARAKMYAEPLESPNPARSDLFVADAMWPMLERLQPGGEPLRARSIFAKGNETLPVVIQRRN
jgi:hypothetical protein